MLASACLVLLIAACNGNDKTPKPLVHVGNNSIEITPPNSGWAEITSAAVVPAENPNCKDGRLFFASGRTMLATDLDGKKVTTVGTNGLTNLDTAEPSSPIYDNHVVKTKGGLLIHTVEAITWSSTVTPQPSWWNLTKEYTTKGRNDPGARGVINVFRSYDCGATWQEGGHIDAAKQTVDNKQGYCGGARLFLDQDGNRKGEVGGWDGHVLNVDPDNGDLYITSICAYGDDAPTNHMSFTSTSCNEPVIVVDDPKTATVETMCRANKWHEDRIIFRSSDEGMSWSVVCHAKDDASWKWRMPITVLSSGRVTHAYVEGGTKLKLESFPKKGTCQDPTATTEDIFSINPDNRDDATKSQAKVNTIIWGSASLARTGSSLPDRVNASVFDWIDNGSRMSYMVIQRKAGDAAQLGQDRIEGNSAGSDVLHGSFVEGPKGSDWQLFYFLERVPATTAGQNNTFRIGFRLYDRGTPVADGDLTLKNSKPYTFPYSDVDFVGDYMSGGSYRKGDQVFFVMPWSQSGGLYFNRIRVVDLTAVGEVRGDPPGGPLPVKAEPVFEGSQPGTPPKVVPQEPDHLVEGDGEVKDRSRRPSVRNTPLH